MLPRDFWVVVLGNLVLNLFETKFKKKKNLLNFTDYIGSTMWRG